MQRDFTLKIYKQLLEIILKNGYHFFTFEDWCSNRAFGKYVILRHDVDLKAINSLHTAEVEHSLGIRASYYFRVVPQSNQPEIISKIAALGHEIGYHYEDLSIVKGDAERALQHFNRQLEYFRQYYPVKTICMHGSPASKYDNRDVWKSESYKAYGVIGEPYFDFLSAEPVYFTDTARMWDGDKYNIRDKKILLTEQENGIKVHSTCDLMEWFEKSDNIRPVMITTHPQRWTDSWLPWLVEFGLQNIKNQFKRILKLRLNS